MINQIQFTIGGITYPPVAINLEPKHSSPLEWFKFPYAPCGQKLQYQGKSVRDGKYGPVTLIADLCRMSFQWEQHCRRHQCGIFARFPGQSPEEGQPVIMEDWHPSPNKIEVTEDPEATTTDD